MQRGPKSSQRRQRNLNFSDHPKKTHSLNIPLMCYFGQATELQNRVKDLTGADRVFIIQRPSGTMVTIIAIKDELRITRNLYVTLYHDTPHDLIAEECATIKAIFEGLTGENQ